MTPTDLRALRERCGLTQRGAARATGVDDRTWRKWEGGDRTIPHWPGILLGIWADPRCPDWAKPWLRKEAAE